MTSVAEQAPTSVKNEKSTGRYRKAVRVAGGLALGAAALAVVPMIGYETGQANNRHDPVRLAIATDKLSNDRLTLSRLEAAQAAYLGQQSAACVTAVQTFLTGGPNAKIATGTAQDIIERSNTCSPAAVSIVSVSRNTDSQIVAAKEPIPNDVASVAGTRFDVEHDYEAVEGLVPGLVADGIVLGVLGLLTLIAHQDNYGGGSYWEA